MTARTRTGASGVSRPADMLTLSIRILAGRDRLLQTRTLAKSYSSEKCESSTGISDEIPSMRALAKPCPLLSPLHKGASGVRDPVSLGQAIPYCPFLFDKSLGIVHGQQGNAE